MNRIVISAVANDLGVSVGVALVGYNQTGLIEKASTVSIIDWFDMFVTQLSDGLSDSEFELLSNVVDEFRGIIWFADGGGK